MGTKCKLERGGERGGGRKDWDVPTKNLRGNDLSYTQLNVNISFISEAYSVILNWFWKRYRLFWILLFK